MRKELRERSLEINGTWGSVYFGGDAGSPDTYQKFYADVEMYTATYDGTTMSLYIDGALAGTAELLTPVDPGTGYLRAGYTDLTNFYLVFGRNFSGNTAPTSYFPAATIDEVVLHSTVLSASQVRAQYAAGRATPG